LMTGATPPPIVATVWQQSPRHNRRPAREARPGRSPRRARFVPAPGELPIFRSRAGNLKRGPWSSVSQATSVPRPALDHASQVGDDHWIFGEAFLLLRSAVRISGLDRCAGTCWHLSVVAGDKTGSGPGLACMQNPRRFGICCRYWRVRPIEQRMAPHARLRYPRPDNQ